MHFLTFSSEKKWGEESFLCCFSIINLFLIDVLYSLTEHHETRTQIQQTRQEMSASPSHSTFSIYIFFSFHIERFCVDKADKQKEIK